MMPILALIGAILFCVLVFLFFIRLADKTAEELADKFGAGISEDLGKLVQKMQEMEKKSQTMRGGWKRRSQRALIELRERAFWLSIG